MVRVVLGATVLVVGSLFLGSIGATEWPRMLLLLAMVPVVLGGGLLMGLDQNPPPWRRRGTAR